jgi:hypothetical protein
MASLEAAAARLGSWRSFVRGFTGKQVLSIALGLVLPGALALSCATSGETDLFGTGGGDPGGEGGAGGSSVTSSSSSGGGTSSSSSSTSSSSSSTSASSSSSASSGGGVSCDQVSCLTQCFQMFQCGICQGNQCVCTPDFGACGLPGSDGGLPGFDGGGFDLDGGFPGFDGGGFDLDGGFPGFDGGGFDGGLPDAFP